MLRQVFRSREGAPGGVALGDQEILVTSGCALAEGLVSLPLNHLALGVDEADQAGEISVRTAIHAGPAQCPARSSTWLPAGLCRM